MKKGIKTLAAAALAVSALTPVAAVAAASNVADGVYTSSTYYDLPTFKKLSTTAKSAALTATGTVVVIGGTVYKATDVLSASDTQLPTLGTSADTYTTVAGNKLVSGQALDSNASVGELKVESVSAINGTITANFSGTGTPTAADFTVTRSINGGTATTVAPTVSYNATTKVATLVVPSVSQTDAAQTVTYSVKYKNTDAKTATFTVAAPSVAVKAIAAAAEPGVTTTTVNVYFNGPVDTASATTAANYRVTPTGAASLVPTKVELNTTAVGPFKANQVATLTFTGTAALGATAGEVIVENVKSNGVTIAKSTVSYLAPASDSTAPIFSTGVPAEDLTLLTPLGSAVPVTGITQGTHVTLNVTPDAGTSTLAAAQYRIVNTSGTTVVDWTNLTPVNNPLDVAKEAVTGVIDTAKVAPGTYTVQVRATDSGANTSAVGATNSTISLVVLGAIADVTAPTFTVAPTGGYSQVEVTGASAQGARTVRVTGTATDTNNITGALASVKSVEYRVREYNTVTGAYTVSTNWTAATAVDGVFDGAAEPFKFVTPQLASGKSYIIETRSTDAAGNIGAVKSVAVTPVAGVITATTAAAGLPAALTDTFSVTADANLPTITLAGTVTGGGALGTAAAPSKERGLVLTGTAADVDAVVSKVEYAVYKDLGNGSRQTIKNWGTDGVSADVGGFDTLSEAYTINYSIPEVNGNGTYIIETRSTDANGSVSIVSSVTHVLDIVAPTVVIAPNTATAATNDFTVTFSEVPVAADGTLSANEFQITNALGGAVTVLNAANALTATADPKAFVLTISNATDKDLILANNILTVVPYVATTSGITDAALNHVSGQYKFTSSDVE